MRRLTSLVLILLDGLPLSVVKVVTRSREGPCKLSSHDFSEPGIIEWSFLVRPGDGGV